MQFYPSYFQLQQIHVSSWRKTAGPTTSKVILPKQVWNSFTFIQLLLKCSQAASEERRCTVPEKCSSLTSSCVMSIQHPRRKECSSLLHSIWEKTGWETMVISYCQNLQGFRTAFKIICEPAFLLCIRVCIKAARWQKFESPLVGLHCPFPWWLMMQRNQDSLRILSPLQQSTMNGKSPFVPFFMAKASATMAKSVHGDVASAYQQE